MVQYIMEEMVFMDTFYKLIHSVISSLNHINLQNDNEVFLLQKKIF